MADDLNLELKQQIIETLDLEDIEVQMFIGLSEWEKVNIQRVLIKLDMIPPEVWKYGKFNDILLHFCNEPYDSKPINKWRKGCFHAN